MTVSVVSTVPIRTPSPITSPALPRATAVGHPFSGGPQIRGLLARAPDPALRCVRRRPADVRRDPLVKIGSTVANAPAHLHEGWAISLAAFLGECRWRGLAVLRRFSRGQQRAVHVQCTPLSAVG